MIPSPQKIIQLENQAFLTPNLAFFCLYYYLLGKDGKKKKKKDYSDSNLHSTLLNLSNIVTLTYVVNLAFVDCFDINKEK